MITRHPDQQFWVLYQTKGNPCQHPKQSLNHHPRACRSRSTGTRPVFICVIEFQGANPQGRGGNTCVGQVATLWSYAGHTISASLYEQVGCNSRTRSSSFEPRQRDTCTIKVLIKTRYAYHNNKRLACSIASQVCCSRHEVGLLLTFEVQTLFGQDLTQL